MAFKKTKQEALDLLQEKEKRLAELTEESAYAVQMVQNTIDNLQAVNSDIQTTMDEIDTYMQRLNDTLAAASAPLTTRMKKSCRTSPSCCALIKEEIH